MRGTVRERACGRLVAVLALVGAGCGRTAPLVAGAGPCTFDHDCPAGLVCLDGRCVTEGGPDAGPEAPPPLKGFGEPCDEGRECQSGYCLAAPTGSFCTIRCERACPVGYDCKLAPDPNEGGAPLGLCALAQSTLCQPCASDTECGATGADLCLEVGGARACGRDCTFTACPDGYGCGGADGGLPGLRQCAPTAATCECTTATVGLTRGCTVSNVHGGCGGAQICQPSLAWTTCSAPTPGPEVCNGLDDDCNGRVDDGLAARPCARTALGFTCRGTETCVGADGWTCDARVPAAETCDYADNNCDGQTDEGFTDGAGRYVALEHCNGCGHDCRALIPHVAEAACVVDESGRPGCRALTCAAGFFPYAGGTLCLTLPANLCQPCAADVDCIGPGSRCLDLGADELACGRDCGAGSAYGPTCPTGYACAPLGAAPQCRPATGTCVCTAANAGTVRACTIATCGGFQTCESAAGSPAWSPCDVADYNPEICDAVDNNCDGRIDEGFLNPATGRYDRDEHCGFCNNDCAKYWSEALQHATGTCDAAPATPVCRMVCLPDWVDVDGHAQNGCECHRISTDDPPDEGPYPTPGQRYVDENCDGVDGVAADALFVSALAAPGGDGTITRPYATIGQALAAFAGSGKQYILVAEGTYRENVALAQGVQLFGGYAGDFRARDIVLHTAIIEGQPPAGPMSGPRAAVHAEGLPGTSPRTVVSGFTIRGADVAAAAAYDEDGQASLAVYVKDCGPGLTLSNSEIVAGRGGPGGRGSTGGRGYGRQTSSALDGARGLDGGRLPAPCQGLAQTGGAGGRNDACGDLGAAPGAGAFCPSFDWTPPKIGQQQAYQAPTNGNGAGGYDLSFDEQSGPACAHMTQGTAPGTLSNHNGKDGQAGQDGADGAGGAGCAAPYGSIAGGGWVPGPAAAADGAPGGSGAPGGGGGAGGGVAAFLTGCGPDGCCPSFEYGATGGGGAAGACGAGGGRAGGSGGAAIGVLVVFSVPPAAGQEPRIAANRIERAFGGRGGEGGFGGLGGLGGAGGFGGNAVNWSGSSGGKGGDGGNGGTGGSGGGGCGGPSYGLLAYHAGGASFAANAFVPAASASTGGLAGPGGSAPTAAARGAPGAVGASANLLALWPCAAGCPPDRVCDAHGVCMPR